MERNAKRILALVIIAVVATGGIVGIYFLLNVPKAYYVTPGVSGVSEDEMIKVGIIGPMTNIQGKNTWNGAWLAAYEINVAGGLTMANGSQYFIALTSEDTKETAQTPSEEVAQAAVERLLYKKKAEYIIGGFRTESVQTYMKTIMDEKKIFLGTGSADYGLCTVQTYGAPYGYPENPNMEKYFFRLMPHNSISLAIDILTFSTNLALGLIYNTAINFGYNGTAEYGDIMDQGDFAITRVAVVSEPFDWAEGMVEFLSPGEAGDLNASIYAASSEATYLTHYEFFELVDPDTTPYSTQVSNIMANHPQMVIPILSDQMSSGFLDAFAAMSGPKPLLQGIDVASSLSTYWNTVGGDCQGEIFTGSSAGLNSSYTPESQIFCSDYNDKFGYWPLYTATGAYDGIRILVEAINETQSFLSDDIVTEMESWTKAAPLVGKTVASPYLAFDNGPVLGPLGQLNMHEVATGSGYYSSYMGQWQDGKMICIWAGADGVSDTSLLTGWLALPESGMYGTPANPF